MCVYMCVCGVCVCVYMCVCVCMCICTCMCEEERVDGLQLEAGEANVHALNLSWIVPSMWELLFLGFFDLGL